MGKSLTNAIGKILDSLPPGRSAEEIEREEKERPQIERAAKWADFAERLGPRYKECRFENFEIQDGKDAARQREVVGSLVAYADEMPQRVRAGQNVVMFGPPGTGKDHLLTALAWSVIIRFGGYVRWTDGTAFYRQARDSFDSNESEGAFIERYGQSKILYFSDPLPPVGNLTPFQAATLFSVIDRRYRDKRPMWFSINVRDSAEAERRLGVAIADRLRENTLALRCEWPSYRKRK